MILSNLFLSMLVICNDTNVEIKNEVTPINEMPSEIQTSEVLRDLQAIEIYLSDKTKYEDFCSSVAWEQPSIDEYKKSLSSLLSDECNSIIKIKN